MASATVAANGGLASSWVNTTISEAEIIAREGYGIAAEAVRFATEKDDTFRLTTRTGDRYVLKIANPSEDPSELSLQTDLLEHIASVDPTLPVPRVIKTTAGLTSFPHLVSGRPQRQARLLSYLPGTPLDSTVSSACERERVGEILARLRLAMVGFSHRADSRKLAWDVQHLMSLEHLLEEISDKAKRTKLEKALTRFANIESGLARCRFQVLHNDFSKSNIVVDHQDEQFVTGIIDFGDAVRTAIAIDVSTALLNQLPSPVSDDIFAQGRDLLRGYLRRADLTQHELALIPHLVMGRLVVRALLTIWRAKLFPENAVYIMRNTEQGWAQLDWFLSRSLNTVSEALVS